MKTDFALPEPIHRLLGTRWRHLKRGTEYLILDIATMQCSVNPELDYQNVVIYVPVGRDPHDTWVRFASEFFDGRFERLD